MHTVAIVKLPSLKYLSVKYLLKYEYYLINVNYDIINVWIMQFDTKHLPIMCVTPRNITEDTKALISLDRGGYLAVRS